MSKQADIYEKIELYLTDQLSGSDKMQFETQLQQDPLLKEELIFQEDIIQSVRDQRTAQLKSRLDNIQLPNAGVGEGTVSGLKLAGSILAIATVGVGTYFYLQEPETLPEASPEVEQIALPRESSPEAEVEPQAKSIETTEYEQLAEAPVEQKLEQIAESTQPSTAQETNPSAKPPTQRLQPNLIEIPAEEEPGSVDAVLDLPALPTGGEDLNEVPEMAVKKIKDGKHDFHYRYHNDKLYLYGDFQDIPYEILDLAGVESRKLYLYYENNFYFIEADQTEITPLNAISDGVLVNELNALRVSKSR